ncbi:MAG: nicotinamide riboside transporter PnuC [Gemmatimonadales bacterium]|nr:MAG: nicotinamide riboside transporter PnuC [Gemmatimonadales bacterium]
MTWLEVVAVVFGAISVYLSVRQNIWSWPTALVNVTLYFLIFRRERLYADMGLQVFYAGISLYGWYYWLFGGEGRTTLRVSHAPRILGVVLPLLGLSAAFGIGTLLDRTTNAAVPYMDSTLTVTSPIAQWMMSRKYLENWIVWVVVDVAYIGMFIYRGLYLTSFLYAVFLVLATRGYIDWRKSLASGPASLPEPAPTT